MREVTYIELADRAHIIGRDETGYLLMVGKNPCGSHSSVPHAFRAWCALFITPRRSWEIGCPANGH
jgi:hypothetical protein